MLTDIIYCLGYKCGMCMSYMYDIVCCTGCCQNCSLFNIGRGIYDIGTCICFNCTCDYEYCLMYCSGCYDGFNNNPESSEMPTNNNEII
jgi:hypothetical protein